MRYCARHINHTLCVRQYKQVLFYVIGYLTRWYNALFITAINTTGTMGFGISRFCCVGGPRSVPNPFSGINRA